MSDWVLSIDFGTTFTTAATWRGGRLSLVEVGGSQSSQFRMPSAVWVDDAGELVVGWRAENQAPLAPERLERAPKQLLGDSDPLQLGRLVAVEEAVAAVLGAVLAEAQRQEGGQPPWKVILTHPASWAERRKAALREAARQAGIQHADLLAEPIAAALYFTEAGDSGSPVRPGDAVAVYDLGGGTFDTAVLRRTGDGSFEPIGVGGRDGLGGEVFDTRLFRHLRRALSEESRTDWYAIERSPRAVQAFRREVRAAKEALSVQGAYDVVLPEVTEHASLRVTRAELERMLDDDVAESVDILLQTCERAEIDVASLAGIFLVGGSSRIPLVGDRIARKFNRVPETRDNPKAVVALGAAGFGKPAEGAGRTATTPAPASRAQAAQPAAAAPAQPTPAPAQPTRAPPAPTPAPPAPTRQQPPRSKDGGEQAERAQRSARRAAKASRQAPTPKRKVRDRAERKSKKPQEAEPVGDKPVRAKRLAAATAESARAKSPGRRVVGLIESIPTRAVVITAVALVGLAGAAALFGGGSGGDVKHIPVAKGPSDIAVGAGAVWVANSKGRSLTRIDAGSAEVTGKPVPIGFDPFEVAAGEGSVWAASSSSQALARLNPGAGSAKKREIQLPVNPYAIAVGAGAVWLVDGSRNSLTRVDVDSGKAGKPRPVGRGPSSVAVGEGSVWVVNDDDDTLVRADPRSGRRVGKPIDIGAAVTHGLAVGGGAAWVLNPDEGTVKRVDADSGEVGPSVRVSKAASGIAADDKAVWVIAETGALVRIDPQSAKAVEGSVDVGESPEGIAVGSGAVWVARPNANEVVRVLP